MISEWALNPVTVSYKDRGEGDVREKRETEIGAI